MAVNRGSLLAHTYDLPQRSVTLPGTSQGVNVKQSSPDFSNFIPKAAEGLEYVQDTTKDYYKKWADLKNFAHAMWNNYGVDVTKPDFSNPASIEANDLFTKAVADLMYQGDQLQTSQKELSKFNEAARSGNIVQTGDTGNQPFSTMDQRDVSFSTQAPDFIKEWNSTIRQRNYTKTERGRVMDLYDQAIDQINQMKQSDPSNSEMYDQWKRSLVKPTYKPYKPDRPKDKDDTDNTKIRGVESFVSRLAGMASGSSESFGSKPSTTAVTEEGDPLYVDDSFSGMKLGRVPILDEEGQIVTKDGRQTFADGIIRRTVYNPKEDQSYLELEDGQRIPLDKEDMMEVAEKILVNNPRFGINPQDIRETLSDYTADGLLPAKPFVSPRKSKITEERKEVAERVKADRKEIASAIKDRTWDDWFGITGGKSIKVKTEKGDLEIKKNLRWFDDNDYDVIDENGEVIDEELSEEDLISLLEEKGVYKESVVLPETEVDTNTNTPDVIPIEEIDEDI